MKKTHSIPLIFGITGHRDLRDEDIPKLKNSLYSLFTEFQTKYPNTELITISALAEGADMLVAEIVKELGLTLHVLLPYQEKEYLNSFEDKENIKKYQELKEYASRVEVNSDINTCSSSVCYQQLGEKIADLSNILLALWDGIDNSKQGGTSAIVKYQRKGFEENRFDAQDGNALFIITTPRKSNPNVKTDFSVHKEYLGKYVKGEEFDNMLKKIDILNSQTDIKELTDNSLAKTYMNYFGENARKNQTRFKNLSKLILILTAIAFASLEIMHVLHIDSFIIGYGVGLLLAFGIYRLFMKNGKVQDDFVYSRGFVEAFRVQNAWNSAKLGKRVAKYYLKNQHHKFTWIKVILKNLYYLDSTSFTPKYEKGSTPEDWINGQIAYFEKAIKLRHKNLVFWEKIEKFLYLLGFVMLILMFVIYTLEVLHIIHHGEWWFNWHYLVMASGLLLMVAAFIGEKYIKIEGYEEEIYNFYKLLQDFNNAKEALEKTEKEREEYKDIIYDLGIKALQENSKWIVLHDKMRVKPSLE